MDERIERALIGGARRYAPPLAPPGWQKPGDYVGPPGELAQGLAGYGVLITVIQPAAGPSALVTPVWVDALQTLYTRLAATLFPSSTGIQAFYVDATEPPILLLHGASIPVMMALSGYVLPYLAARQGTNPPDSELTALCEAALDWLEAGDLPRPEVAALRDESVSLLWALVSQPVTVRALAPAMPGAPIPARSRPAPPSLPEAKPKGSTPPPMTLPENAAPARPAPAGVPEAGPPRPPLPVVFEPPPRPARRRPPLPD